MSPAVIKVGGNELDDPQFLDRLAEAVAALPQRPVIVHGGGRGTSGLAERLGLQSRFVDGLRVTDEATLEAAVMGLVGMASVRLVSALSAAGIPALGLCGADARLVVATRMVHPAGDLGRVGTPVRVDAEGLGRLLEAGFVPCLAPICAGDDGGTLNVNADTVAQAVAAALQASALVMLTNVPGVKADGDVLGRLTPETVESLISSGTIQGGMIPKTRAACAALAAGVAKVLITDLDGLRAGRGTEIISGVTQCSTSD
ncbi:MAG: acetylglutamate kinase [Armatimonadetes bacterium]|nr:acetylglutamate kinase [Armatimonadota bacterium]